MATIGIIFTLADWAKRLDPDGKVAKIVESLSLTNEVLDDMLFKEGNLPTGERTTIRTGLPSAYWRLLNQGVPTSKSTTAQVDEQCGTLEARSQVDEDDAKLNGNVKTFRLTEAQAFLQSLNNEMASNLFYGNSGTSPEKFTGFAPRYSSLSATNAQNIIDAGGTGTDNTSVWLVGWSYFTAHGIFPKGSKAGIIHEDLGLGDAFDSNNNRFRAYMDRWQWKMGLVVKDWRYVVRICNIDVSNLVAGTGADLIDKMARAIYRFPDLKLAKPVFYCNRTVLQMLDIQRRNDVYAAGGTYADVDGKRVRMFQDIPIRLCDSLTLAEARVT